MYDLSLNSANRMFTLWLMEAMFRIFHAHFPQLELEYHGHSDFNLAIACAVSAIKGGATVGTRPYSS